MLTWLSACGGGGGGGGGGGSNGGNPDGFPEMVLETEKGRIRIVMDTSVAPETVVLMSGLILLGSYDNQTFFDVQPGRLVQFGDADPLAAQVEAIVVEPTGAPLERGSVAIAWVGSKNTTTHRLIMPLTRLDAALDDHFTVFGRIIEGEGVLDTLAAGDGVFRVSSRLSQPIMRLSTEAGSIVIKLDDGVAPNHVARVSDLTCQGFYNGLTFHRVEPELIQTGDPTGTGEGGTGQTIPAELNARRFFRTAVGMARKVDDLDSADSQFFIMRRKVDSLDGAFTFIGEVLAGMQAVDAVKIGDVVLDAALQFDLQGRECVTAEPPPPPTSGGGGDFNGGPPA